MITGSALLVLVGVVAAMGASPSPSDGPDLGHRCRSVGRSLDRSGTAASAAPAHEPKAPTRRSRSPRGPGGLRGRGGPGIGFHDITITAIDGSSLSLTTEDGWTRTIEVTDTTTITKGGATITLGDLAVGDEIRFRQERATDGTYTVTAIVVVLPHVVGEITAIDGSTITVTQPGGTTATIHVDSDTTYRIAGAAGSLADLKVGAVIVAEGTQRADGSLDADVDRQRAQGRPRTPRLPGRPRSRQGPGRQPGTVERRELIDRGPTPLDDAAQGPGDPAPRSAFTFISGTRRSMG